MIGIGLVFLACIIAFVVGLIIWNVTNGDGNKFDQKGYESIMNAKEQKEQLEEAMSRSVRAMNSKTRQALKEDLGEYEFRRLMRG